jgi:hypothetical protein
MGASVRFAGTRYSVETGRMRTLFRVYCGMQSLEAEALADRVLAGERLTVDVEDVDAAYSLASEMVELGVNAEADEGYD